MLAELGVMPWNIEARAGDPPAPMLTYPELYVMTETAKRIVAARQEKARKARRRRR